MSGAEDGRREASLKSVVENLATVTERTQHIVRDEIELAKAEVSEKVGQLGRGAAVGIAAGVFAAVGSLFLLHAIAWFLGQEVFSGHVYWGYLVVAVLLFVLAGVGGFLALKFVKKGAPPVPQMAIDEAKLIRESVQKSGSSSTGALESTPGGPERTLGTVDTREHR